MRTSRRLSTITILISFALTVSIGVAEGQVSPAELTKPNLKQVEKAHFEQLVQLNRAISEATYPYPLILSRYPGLDPKRQAGSDRRGLEFIQFEDRVVLKVSADYNAAFSAQTLTQNQRASRVFKEVAIPILKLLPKYVSTQEDFQGVGFEIAYHVRTVSTSYSYEGKEVLSVVLNNDDAFKLSGGGNQPDWQEVLDNSEVFLDAKPFGLMLDQRDPVPVAETPEEKPPRKRQRPPKETAAAEFPQTNFPRPGEEIPAGLKTAAQQAPASPDAPDTRALLTGHAPATQAEADALQARLQTQIEALNVEGRAHDNFVNYAPPSFAVFRKQIYLQLTMRNPTIFDPDATSIYKRAARSFDLFLAPRLKSLLAKVPQDPSIAGLDITVLTEFSSKAASSSEAIEFICPLKPLSSFADAEITNQDLINQSVVLVNGVRIALNLQQVE